MQLRMTKEDEMKLPYQPEKETANITIHFTQLGSNMHGQLHTDIKK